MLVGLLLFARGAHATQLARLDDNDRRLALQAFHLRRLFPGSLSSEQQDRISRG